MTVHTSTKACLTSSATWRMSMNEHPLSISPNSDKSRKQSLYPDRELDRHRNLIICSLAHCQPSLKISCKSVWKFLCKAVNKQTMAITYPPISLDSPQFGMKSRFGSYISTPKSKPSLQVLRQTSSQYFIHQHAQ